MKIGLKFVVFGCSDQLDGCAGTPGPPGSYIRPFIRNLGRILDSAFKFDKQISSAAKSFFQLRLLAKIKPYLSYKDFERVIHASITTPLDHCNSLYVSLEQSSLHQLQLAQNAAAQLLTRTRKREHIISVLASLLWLPIHFRIDFKILLLVFKVLNGLAPPYLCELLHVHTPVKALRSSSQMALDVPRSRLKNRAFSVAAPNL